MTAKVIPFRRRTPYAHGSHALQLPPPPDRAVLAWRWAVAHEAAIIRLMQPLTLDGPPHRGRLLLAALYFQGREFEGGLRLATTTELLWLAQRDHNPQGLRQAVAKLEFCGTPQRQAQLWAAWNPLRNGDLAWLSLRLPLEWALIVGEVPIETRQRIFQGLWAYSQGLDSWTTPLPFPWQSALSCWLPRLESH